MTGEENIMNEREFKRISDKAKTVKEITDWVYGLTLPYDEKLARERRKVLWVRLEDAQKEIDELKQELYQESMLKCKTSDCVNWENGDCSYGFAYRMHYCEPYRRASEKFWELLKEEKGSKTHE